ncbi:glucuronate isomerase [Mariniblastus sp.]|nr:glucuronate isomerase [Mariniblastus sp.]
MGRFLDRLDRENMLPKTIVYNLNPSDNYLISTMIGNFQGGEIAGKMQFGSGWWYLDQKEGMEWQINALSSTGLISRFVGMLTDSRSFMSFIRHEYFRRILCNLFGKDMASGEMPNDFDFVGGVVQDICYGNAKRFLELEGS